MKILFRKTLAEENEFDVANKYFDVIENRSLIKSGDEVLCRYSCLPYHDELEQDVKIIGASLINSYKAHRYVADMNNWYYDLEEFTPKTWFSLYDFMQSGECGPVVLKGETNSRKQLWKTHMFAEDVDRVKEIYFKLQEDSLLGHQNICIRKFEYFVNYGAGINGLPITKEFRVFIFDGSIVGSGFYWSTHPEIVSQFNPQMDNEAISLLNKIIEIVGSNIRFFVVDIAQRQDGEWRVVELNDGCMAGISCMDADIFYGNLLKKIGVKK